jgi:predicted RNase H-like HicB family nuclease
MKSLKAIIEQAEEGGYFAYCPEVAGANGQGENIEDCCKDLQLAIELIFEDLRKRSPKPHIERSTINQGIW